MKEYIQHWPKNGAETQKLIKKYTKDGWNVHTIQIMPDDYDYLLFEREKQATASIRALGQRPKIKVYLPKDSHFYHVVDRNTELAHLLANAFNGCFSTSDLNSIRETLKINVEIVEND